MLVEKICPAVDVDIVVIDDGQRSKMGASDWMEIAPHNLFSRVLGVSSLDDLQDPSYANDIASRLRPIYAKDGDIIGRLALDLRGQATSREFRQGGFSTSAPNVVVDGGLQNGTLGSDIAGVIFGTTSTISRDAAEVTIPPDSFRDWINWQLDNPPSAQWNSTMYAFICHACGRRTLDGAEVCYTSQGPMSIQAVKDWAKDRNKVFLSFSISRPVDLSDGILHGLTYMFANSWLVEQLSAISEVENGVRSDEMANMTSGLAVCAVLESWDIFVKGGFEIEAMRILTENLERGTTGISKSDRRETNVVHILDRSSAIAELLSEVIEERRAVTPRA